MGRRTVWVVTALGWGAVATAQDAAPSAPSTPGDAATHNGSLSGDDPTLSNGEHFDTYDVQLGLGDRLTAALYAPGFDGYVMVVAPLGPSLQNDDWQGDPTLSKVVVDAQAPGTWTVYATSSAAGETGDYTLTLGIERGANPDLAAVPLSDGLVREGRLEDGDWTIPSGEYWDVAWVSGKAGQEVEARMSSGDVDAYVALKGPGDFHKGDDDGGDGRDARLRATLPADGLYQVMATSAKPGETGAYRLSVRAWTEADAQRERDAAAEARRAARGGQVGVPQKADAAFSKALDAIVEAVRTQGLDAVAGEVEDVGRTTTLDLPGASWLRIVDGPSVVASYGSFNVRSDASEVVDQLVAKVRGSSLSCCELTNPYLHLGDTENVYTTVLSPDGGREIEVRVRVSSGSGFAFASALYSVSLEVVQL